MEEIGRGKSRKFVRIKYFCVLPLFIFIAGCFEGVTP